MKVLAGISSRENLNEVFWTQRKKLPFKAGFKQMVITDPLQVPAAIEKFTGHPKVEGIIIDSLSFLLNMYENQYVVTSTNTQQA